MLPRQQMLFERSDVFLSSNGYRCIAARPARHGRSSQPWQRQRFGTYAMISAELTEALGLKECDHVGPPATGGGEVHVTSTHGSSPPLAKRFDRRPITPYGEDETNHGLTDAVFD